MLFMYLLFYLLHLMHTRITNSANRVLCINTIDWMGPSISCLGDSHHGTIRGPCRVRGPWTRVSQRLRHLRAKQACVASLRKTVRYGWSRVFSPRSLGDSHSVHVSPQKKGHSPLITYFHCCLAETPCPSATSLYLYGNVIRLLFRMLNVDKLKIIIINSISYSMYYIRI